MGLFSKPELIEAKSPEQLKTMRQAGLIVAKALETVCAAAQPGVTTGQLDKLAETFIRDHRAVPSFLGYQGFTGTLCTSVNEEIVHGIPGARVLKPGDLLSIDCGAIVSGWHGDAARSVIVGDPADARLDDLALIEATEQATWAGIAALTEGGYLNAVGAAIEDSIEESGRQHARRYGIVEDFAGHGIGRQMHMEPMVMNYRVREKGPVTPVGTTIAIEPMLTLGDQANETLADEWTVVTKDRSRACHWENTVALTASGTWVLTEIDGGQARLEALGVPFGGLN